MCIHFVPTPPPPTFPQLFFFTPGQIARRATAFSLSPGKRPILKYTARRAFQRSAARSIFSEPLSGARVSVRARAVARIITPVVMRLTRAEEVPLARASLFFFRRRRRLVRDERLRVSAHSVRGDFLRHFCRSMAFLNLSGSPF